MKRLLLTTGLVASIAINLNTQGQSIAGLQTLASRSGVTSASLLAQEKKTMVAHEHTVEVHEVVHPNVDAKQVSPRRRVVTKAAADEVTMFAAIDRSDATMEHKLLFNEALHTLPTQCQNTLQNFYVKYEKQEHRGLAGKSVMILDGTVQREDELRALFIHESGHNIDLGCLQGTASSGKSAFSDGDDAVYKDDPSVAYYSISWITSGVHKSNTRPEDFVSGYASYDIWEDFSEGFAYFMLHNDEFAKRAEDNAALAKKYAFFRDVLFGGTVPQVATGKTTFSGKVPWDITKLAYSWHPTLAIARSN